MEMMGGLASMEMINTDSELEASVTFRAIWNTLRAITLGKYENPPKIVWNSWANARTLRSKQPDPARGSL